VVAQADQGRWQPRGSGLLVAVVALSVVALLAHGAIALVLLSGTVRPPVSSNRPVGRPTPRTARRSSRGSTTPGHTVGLQAGGRCEQLRAFSR